MRTSRHKTQQVHKSKPPIITTNYTENQLQSDDNEKNYDKDYEDKNENSLVI